MEPDDISQKKSIEHWCLLFTLSYTVPGVPLRLQCHLGSKPSKMMYSLKRKDSIFAQERHTVVMAEFPKSLNEQTPASSVIPSLAFIIQPSLSPTFKQSEKRALLRFIRERGSQGKPQPQIEETENHKLLEQNPLVEGVPS